MASMDNTAGSDGNDQDRAQVAVTPGAALSRDGAALSRDGAAPLRDGPASPAAHKASTTRDKVSGGSSAVES